MEYKVKGKYGIRLSINMCFNNSTEFDEEFVQNELYGNNISDKTAHSASMISIVRFADSNNLTARYLIDKKFNIVKKEEFKPVYNIGDSLSMFFSNNIVPTYAKFIADEDEEESCIITAMDEAYEEGLEPIFNILLEDLIKEYKRKLSTAKIHSIKESLCGLAVYISSMIIPWIREVDEHPERIYKNAMPCVHEVILVNPKEDNLDLARFNKGLLILRDLFPNNIKLSKLLNEAMEQLIPFYMNANGKSDDNSVRHLNNDALYLDFSLFVENFTTLTELKGLLVPEYKKLIQEFKEVPNKQYLN